MSDDFDPEGHEDVDYDIDVEEEVEEMPDADEEDEEKSDEEELSALIIDEDESKDVEIATDQKYYQHPKDMYQQHPDDFIHPEVQLITVVDPDDCRTSDVLFQSEMTGAICIRTSQIAREAHTFVDT